MAGICPKCGKAVMSALLEEIQAKEGIGLGAAWNCISFLCPSCRCVLGIQVDPIAVRSDTVSDIAKLLKSRRG